LKQISRLLEMLFDEKKIQELNKTIKEIEKEELDSSFYDKDIKKIEN